MVQFQKSLIWASQIDKGAIEGSTHFASDLVANIREAAKNRGADGKLKTSGVCQEAQGAEKGPFSVATPSSTRSQPEETDAVKNPQFAPSDIPQEQPSHVEGASTLPSGVISWLKSTLRLRESPYWESHFRPIINSLTEQTSDGSDQKDPRITNFLRQLALSLLAIGLIFSLANACSLFSMSTAIGRLNHSPLSTWESTSTSSAFWNLFPDHGPRVRGIPTHSHSHIQMSTLDDHSESRRVVSGRPDSYLDFYIKYIRDGEIRDNIKMASDGDNGIRALESAKRHLFGVRVLVKDMIGEEGPGIDAKPSMASQT
jgi:hypothetical protein